MSSKKSKIFDHEKTRPHDIGVLQRFSSRDGEPVRLEILSLAAGGRGVARNGGAVWFVPRAVPGDLVLAAPRTTRKGFVEGEMLALLRPSPSRRQPPCAYQADCGGCPWMVLGEGDQRDWKRRTLLDALERIGGLRDLPLAPLVAPGPPTGYRNKVEFSLGPGAGGRPALGLHSGSATGRIVDVARCLLQHEDT